MLGLVISVMLFAMFCGIKGQDSDEPFCTYGGDWIPNLFCGRGGSPCPLGYRCNVHPTDRWAVCCPDGFCPNGLKFTMLAEGRTCAGVTRNTRFTCPPGFQCIDDVFGARSACCQYCPPGMPMPMCAADPCTVTTCTAHPNAICRATFCGGCNAEFFLKGERVTCELPVCEQPMDVGPCDGDVPRYYYDSLTEECTLFHFGGCEGNDNNFDTLADCQNECNVEAIQTCPQIRCPSDCATVMGENGCPICSCPNCLHDGVWHVHGSTWTPDDCSSCSCTNGEPLCNVAQCARPQCPNPRHVDGQCCPHCDDCTLVRCAQTCPVGQAGGVPPGECCATCIESDAATTCDPDDLVQCLVDPCDVTSCPAYPDAQCISNYCGGCNAEFFDADGNQLESRWSAFSDFGECSKPCGGGVKCKHRTCLKCGDNECRGTDIRKRRCNIQPCPCTYNGCGFGSGETFAAIDGCNTCTCNNGAVGCTKIGCASDIAPTARKTRKRCYENDQWYAIMDRWTYTECDRCFICKCKLRNCKRRCKRVIC